MAVPNRITLVTLGVTDVARSAAFHESLGWTTSDSSVDGELAFFDASLSHHAPYVRRSR